MVFEKTHDLFDYLHYYLLSRNHFIKKNTSVILDKENIKKMEKELDYELLFKANFSIYTGYCTCRMYFFYRGGGVRHKNPQGQATVNHQDTRYTASDDSYRFRFNDCERGSEQRLLSKYQKNKTNWSSHWNHVYQCLDRVYSSLRSLYEDDENSSRFFSPDSYIGGFVLSYKIMNLFGIFTNYHQDVREECLSPIYHAISVFEDILSNQPDNQDNINRKIKTLKNVIDNVKSWRNSHPHQHVSD